MTKSGPTITTEQLDELEKLEKTYRRVPSDPLRDREYEIACRNVAPDLIAEVRRLQHELNKATSLVGDMFKTDYDAAVIERKRAEAAEKRVAELEAQLSVADQRLFDGTRDLNRRAQKAEADRAVLVEVLRWYASETNYLIDKHGHDSEDVHFSVDLVTSDCGVKARAVLAKVEEKT